MFILEECSHMGVTKGYLILNLGCYFIVAVVLIFLRQSFMELRLVFILSGSSQGLVSQACTSMPSLQSITFIYLYICVCFMCVCVNVNAT